MCGDFTNEELRLIQHALRSYQHNTGYHALISKVEMMVERSVFGYGPQLPFELLKERTTPLS